jgi:hypothetical protein
MPFSVYKGTWTLEKELAVFKSTYGATVCYNQATLKIAVENTKNSREHHATHEACKRALLHFERGLALFNDTLESEGPLSDLVDSEMLLG